MSAVALARPQCTDKPKSDWMPEEAMKQKIAEQGYTVDKFKTTDGNCYEIYGKDKDGQSGGRQPSHAHRTGSRYPPPGSTSWSRSPSALCRGVSS
ncbi:PepSY domain-containing protein [Aromatoleum aromaticum]|uniref:PepSY domain-containing protein n=1 Tax=Aromatoleum aromaticum TaxID=551760 RepID=UPI0002DF20A9|nr:PepSY domain-containing protein [Aromatoleum aromaticum]